MKWKAVLQSIYNGIKRSENGNGFAQFGLQERIVSNLFLPYCNKITFELLYKCKIEGGESMTQEDIYRENYPIVYGYLLSLCGDIPLAEDLAAENFFKAFLHPRRYDGQCKLSTWLCTIGRNLYINEGKRQRRSCRLPTPPASAPNPEELLLEKELLAQLYRTTRQLEPPMVRCFLCGWKGSPSGRLARQWVRLKIGHE